MQDASHCTQSLVGLSHLILKTFYDVIMAALAACFVWEFSHYLMQVINGSDASTNK